MTEDNDEQEDGQHEIPLRGEKTMNSCLRMNGMGVVMETDLTCLKC